MCCEHIISLSIKMSTTVIIVFLVLVLNVLFSFSDLLSVPGLGHHQSTLKSLVSDVEIEVLKKYIESYEHLPSLVNEISELDKKGGVKEYKKGLRNEDVHLNITELITKYGFEVETHTVTTKDKYILNMFRIPSAGPPVFLMHGLLSSACDFVAVGHKSLPYLLAQAGYDVWLGNARGNRYCRNHEHLSPKRDKAVFFDFSWHEIGIYDLPAMIDYVLDKTGYQDLSYIGHSQGTTSFFVMCSERPEYNKKVNLMISLATVAYMPHLVSPFARLLSPVSKEIKIALALIGTHEFAPDNLIINLFTKLICGGTALATLVCSSIVFTIAGFDPAQLNITNNPNIFAHAAAGASTKQFIHYAQGINTGKFRQYDYGIIKNKRLYGDEEPPQYNVENIIAPVAIFHANNDWLAAKRDVQKLMKRLPNVVHYYEIPWKKFSHTDYLWARDVDRLVYSEVMELLEKYNFKDSIYSTQC